MNGIALLGKRDVLQRLLELYTLLLGYVLVYSGTIETSAGLRFGPAHVNVGLAFIIVACAAYLLRHRRQHTLR